MNSPPSTLDAAARTLGRDRLPGLRAGRSDATTAVTRAPVELLHAALRPVRLSLAAARALAALGRRHHVTPGTLVLRRGDDARALWLLEQGSVSLGGHDVAQRWLSTRSVRGGEWIDAASAWLGSPLIEGALAESDCTLWEFNAGDVEHVCLLHPGLWRALLALLAARVRRLTGEKHGLLSQDVLARCALWLLDALADSPDGGTVVLAQRKRSLAAQLGATPETFSRTLRQLRESGVIEVQGYRIRVCDAAALRQLAIDGAPRRSHAVSNQELRHDARLAEDHS
jgi:CRP-like cAMP-binding protein